MSDDGLPAMPLSDQLATSLRVHALRMDELRNFFKSNKIKMSVDQKTELNEIIDSLSSALNSVILSKAAKKIGETISSTVKEDLLNVIETVKNKPLSSATSPSLRPITQTSLPSSYACRCHQSHE